MADLLVSPYRELGQQKVTLGINATKIYDAGWKKIQPLNNMAAFYCRRHQSVLCKKMETVPDKNKSISLS